MPIPSSPQPTFAIITPTFHRERLLRRFLKRILGQSNPHWRSLIIHDGPGEPTRALLDRFKAKDPRIEFINTPARANDFGVTPRHAGLERLADNPPDYCVLWDDDNYFRTDALHKIATALKATNYPDVLLVSMEYHARPLPPPGVPVADLHPGEIDTACLVMRPPLALAGYETILHQKQISPGESLYTQDFMLFNFLRQLQPALRIEIAPATLIGVHDGLRWKPYLRHLLGIGPLNLHHRV